MSRPVYIADSGLICARGDTTAGVAEALWQGESGAGKRHLGEREFPYFALPLTEENWLQRAEQAIHQVARQLEEIAPATPLFIASSSFQIGYLEQQGAPFDLPLATASLSRKIAEWMDLSGQRYSFSNACISGFSAIDAASTLIAAGAIDEAIVLGFELANNATLAGFASMELLSRTTCRPFDARRDGLVLGEAVAAIRLTAKPSPWKITGLRTGLDGYSTTGPDPDGGPIANTAIASLKAANVGPAEIDLVKLQAAGSPGTDLAEATALHKVFGTEMPPLLSLKPALGHTLGASGITELVALLACLEAGKTPATAGFAEADPELGLMPITHRNNDPVRRAMLNLIGFGGGLATMIVERT
ncbi:MAG: Beta-ketoacyl synthase [Proteobacteria bacterium]|nr:Beta-ketoacyl synthase [Pseudomonadota bacterium]